MEKADKNAPKDVIKRLQKLKETIEYHRHAYHSLDRPEITDEAYDSLLRELEAVEAKYPHLRAPDSPSQRVGGAPLDEFVKILFEINREIRENPETVLNAPHTTPVGRIDEVTAARQPNLR